MMRAFILVASLVMISPFASAQSQSSSQPGLGYVSARADTDNRDHMNGPRSECLMRKKDRKRVCHTRAEWRQIAAQIEHGDTKAR